jgi:ethanolamine ammonia-lyase small subunit
MPGALQMSLGSILQRCSSSYARSVIRLRDYTSARVELGRAGNSLPTRALLEFQLAHARARDAVHLPLAINSLVLELKQKGIDSVSLSSAARDRDEYLKRPDLGRRLSDDSRERLAGLRSEYDAAFIIADGLSALAVHRHAVPLLGLLLRDLDWRIAPFAIVEQGRVAIGDEIGELLGARMVVVLIGERPGLSSPDSLGAYLTWQPRAGRTDAERNCVSNIRAEGLSYELAAHKLQFLMNESRRLKLSGIQLKEAAGLMGDSMSNSKLVSNH